MRRTLLAIAVLSLAAGCSRSTDRAEHDSAARKVGHVAYGAAQETKKVAKKAGHELREAARDMHQGWKDAKQEDKTRRRNP